MPNTYSQIYIQIVFAVKGRQNLIHPDWKAELNQYISGIITNKGQKSIIVNGVPDHIHVFVGLKPSISISDLVRDIKNNSSNFINRQGWINGRFAWQEGFGAFSYSQSHIENVYSISSIRRNTIRKKISGRNIWNFCRNLKWNIMRNIYLNGLKKNNIISDNNVIPPGFSVCVCPVVRIMSSLQDC